MSLSGAPRWKTNQCQPVCARLRGIAGGYNNLFNPAEDHFMPDHVLHKRLQAVRNNRPKEQVREEVLAKRREDQRQYYVANREQILARNRERNKRAK